MKKDANIELSVIVAVYNAEKFLQECMESLLLQTIDKMEIIVVNDGSSDHSQDIIEKYERKYKNIKVICKKNEGTLLTRLEGMCHAEGQFIAFVDGDDTFVPNALCQALYTAKEKKVDILEFGYHLINAEKQEIFKRNMSHTKMPVNTLIKGEKNCFSLLDSYKLEVPLFKRLYSRQLCQKVLRYFKGFTDYKVRFKGFLNEDEFMTPIFFANARSYYCITEKIYNYVFQSPGGITYDISRDSERKIRSAEEYMCACAYISKELRKKRLVTTPEYICYNMKGIDFFMQKSNLCKMSFKERILRVRRYYSVKELLYNFFGKTMLEKIKDTDILKKDGKNTKKIKFIAFYLPQFHEVEENNMWWGKGYTEWTSVKASKPLYYGHKQPRIPYNDNYYDLLDKKVMIWQSQIAMKAGIDGFCFYHYWFKGRKILEKPVENYLNWKEIPQRFCLSWANDSWIRSWSNVSGTIWNSVKEKGTHADGGQDEGFLIKQDYGGRDVWKEHFDYLINFFLDKRYIKIDNKPLFLIHRPEEIKQLNSMIQYWNTLSHQYGFSGVYVLVTNPLKKYNAPICGCVNYEPANAFDYKPLKRKIYEWAHVKDQKKLLRKYSYTNLWVKILKRKPDYNMKTYLGAFVGYDDSPRRGYQSYIVKGSTPFKFQVFLQLLMKKCRSSEQFGDYVFITAWNEWAEGAYLEPDQNNQYGYLKAIKKVKSN